VGGGGVSTPGLYWYNYGHWSKPLPALSRSFTIHFVRFQLLTFCFAKLHWMFNTGTLLLTTISWYFGCRVYGRDPPPPVNEGN